MHVYRKLLSFLKEFIPLLFFVLKFTLSDSAIVSQLLYGICIIFLSFSFNLSIPFYFKWICCSSMQLGFAVFQIQYDNFSFIGVFKLFTFNVIIDIVEFISTILLAVFYLIHLFFVSFFFFSPFSCKFQYGHSVYMSFN